MQTILSADEVSTIYEALLTEKAEMCEERKKDERLGRTQSVKLDTEYIEKIDALIQRFEPYLKRG